MFYRIQIGDIYLTKTGANGGIPCKLSVTNADALVLGFVGQTVKAIDGTPINKIIALDKGIDFEINVEILMKAQFDAIKTLITNALSNSSTINVVGTGDGGNFDVDAVPSLPQPFAHQEFKNGRMKSVTFKFATI